MQKQLLLISGTNGCQGAGGSCFDELGYEVQFDEKADINSTYFGRDGLAPTGRELIDAGPGSSITNFGTCLEDMAWSNDSSSSGAHDTSVHDTGPGFTSSSSFANTLHPSLDMPSALQMMGEQGKHISEDQPAFDVPSLQRPQILEGSQWRGRHAISARVNSFLEISTEELDAAHKLPPRGLRNRLVRLYFRHVHPLCPIVDEFAFAESYSNTNDGEELGENINLLLFQSMMFAAAAHISDSDLVKSSFEKLHSLQGLYFSRAKTLYTCGFTDDQLTLAHTAILLSYWSPYNSEFRVNSYWIDRAFYHARNMDLWDNSRDSGSLSCRRQITWWCCLIRDRLVSLGLRRPHRLQGRTSVRPMIQWEDFGLESCQPTYTNRRSKKIQMSAFIALAKLSEVMAKIATFQSDNSFNSEWSLDCERNTLSQADLDQIRQLFEHINQWKTGYRGIFMEGTKSVLPRSSKIPLYMLQVLGDSLVATLYQPYLDARLKSTISGNQFRAEAFDRVRTACAGIASTAADIHSHCSNEDIPLAMTCWLAFPLAVFQVESKMNRGHLTMEFDRQFANLNLLLRKIGVRFVRADYFSNAIHEATKSINGNIGGHEADVLDVVGRFLNLRIARTNPTE